MNYKMIALYATLGIVSFLVLPFWIFALVTGGYFLGALTSPVRPKSLESQQWNYLNGY